MQYNPRKNRIMPVIDGNGIVGEARVWATQEEANQDAEIARLKKLLITIRKDALESAAKILDARSKDYADTPHNAKRRVSEIEDMLDDLAAGIRGLSIS